MFTFSSRRIALFPVVFALLTLPSVVSAAGPVMRMPVMARTPMMAPAPMMAPMPMMAPGAQQRMMPGAMGMPFGQNFTPMGTFGNQAFLGNPYANSGFGAGSGYLMNPGYGSYMMSRSGYSGSGYSGSGYSGNNSSMMSQGGYGSSGAGRVGGSQPYSSAQGSAMAWPLGTRLLADGEPLRKDIEASVLSLMDQSAQGKVDKELVARTIREIDELRNMIVQQGTRGVVSEQTIRTAVQFLDELTSALRSL
jgi:hypothetical protein